MTGPWRVSTQVGPDEAASIVWNEDTGERGFVFSSRAEAQEEADRLNEQDYAPG